MAVVSEGGNEQSWTNPKTPELWQFNWDGLFLLLNAPHLWGSLKVDESVLQWQAAALYQITRKSQRLVTISGVRGGEGERE